MEQKHVTQPGTLIHPHRPGQGHETSRHLIEAGGENPGIVAPMGLKCLESGTVIMEGKDGAWEPLKEEEILRI